MPCKKRSFTSSGSTPACATASAPRNGQVGNDFLPHMPSLEIRDGAIDTLCDLYKTHFASLGGWICDGGSIDLARAKLFCTELGKLEDELLLRHRNTEERCELRARTLATAQQH